MQMIEGIPIWGEALPEVVAQMKEAMKYEAVYGALMADHHIGYSVPIGGFIAYEGRICVNGVGFDIACGCQGCKEKWVKAQAAIDEMFTRATIDMSFDIPKT